MVRPDYRFRRTIVLPEIPPYCEAALYHPLVDDPSEVHCTIAYGERFPKSGLHIMQCPTIHEVETLTGLAPPVWRSCSFGWQRRCGKAIPLVTAHSDQLDVAIRRSGSCLSASDPPVISAEILSWLSPFSAANTPPPDFWSKATSISR